MALDRLPDPSLSRAVLIGASRFTSLEDLPAVAGNLGALAELLAAQWGMPRENCKELLNPATPGAASKLVREVAAAATDTLLVYYAGHGLLGPRGNLYVAVPDSDPASVYDTSVPYEWIRHAVSSSPAGRRIVILDCCYSARAFGPQSGKVVELAEVDGTFVLAAAAETAVALAPPGDPLTAFTAALTDVLRTGVADAPELLDLDTVYERLHALLMGRGRPEPQSLDRNRVGRMAFARNAAFTPVPVVPAPLPESVRIGLDSPYPAIRKGAVAALGEWLAGGDPSRVATARATLVQVANEDTPAVAQAARVLLLAHPDGGDDVPAPDAAPVPTPRRRPRPRHLLSLRTRLRRGTRVRLAAVLLAVLLTAAGSGPLVGAVRAKQTPEPPDYPAVRLVAFSADGKTLFTSTYDKVWRWDISGEGSSAKPEPSSECPVECLAFGPGGKTVIGVDYSGVQFGDVLKGTMGRDLKEISRDRDVNAAALSFDSKKLATGGEDGTVRLWNAEARQHLTDLKGHTGEVMSVAFSPNGKLFASAGGNEKDIVQVSDLATGRAAFNLRVMFPRQVTFSGDGKLLAIASIDDDIRLWETGTLKPYRKLAGHTGWVNTVDFSKDGLLLSGSHDHTVRLWDPRSGKQLRVLGRHTDDVQAVAFSPDGKTAASAGDDGTARVWEVATGRRLHELVHKDE